MRLCTDVSKEIMYTMSRDEDGTLYVREGGSFPFCLMLFSALWLGG